MTEKTEYITASIELLEKRDGLNSDELAVLCNLKKFMKNDHQPTFAVGEYYSFTTYRKDYDADTTFIFKALGIKGCGIRVIEYDIHGREFSEYVYDIDSDFLKEATPATAEQIATFKKAEYFSSKGRKLNEFDYGDKVYVPAVASGIIKSIDKGSVFIIELADGTEIHFDGSRYEELALLKTDEELQEVENGK